MFKKNLKIKLYKSSLAFALISNLFEEPHYDDINLNENKILLSKEFVEYLMTAMNGYIDYRTRQPIIEKVLFI